jgi:thiol:disulfide interchange protein DsbA
MVSVFGRVLLMCAGLFAVLASAQDNSMIRVNQDYRLVTPQQPVNGSQIEVIDFFWYGCPYCNQLQPHLDAWIKRKPADVTVRRIPAVMRENWIPHARIFYTLETLGEVERLHPRVYHSYHVEELSMSKPDVMEEWAVRNGIDRQRWIAAYNSSEVQQKSLQAAELTRRYQVQGTPSLIVDGRYITSSGMVETVQAVFPVVDELIKLARQQRGAR